VPDYANEQRQAYAIDEPMKALDRLGSVSERPGDDYEGEKPASRVGHTGDPIDGD